MHIRLFYLTFLSLFGFYNVSLADLSGFVEVDLQGDAIITLDNAKTTIVIPSLVKHRFVDFPTDAILHICDAQFRSQGRISEAIEDKAGFSLYNWMLYRNASLWQKMRITWERIKSIRLGPKSPSIGGGNVWKMVEELNPGETVMSPSFSLKKHGFSYIINYRLSQEPLTAESIARDWLDILQFAASKEDIKTVALSALRFDVYVISPDENAAISVNAILDFIEQYPNRFDTIVLLLGPYHQKKYIAAFKEALD